MERKEAIEVVKKNWPDSSFTRLREALETLIPELQESEDERIRKEMIFYFQEEIPQCSIQEHSDKMREFISWLKRQEIECIKLELKAGNSYFCYKSRWERADNETFKKGLIYKCNKDGVLDNFVIKNPEQHFIEIKDERIAWLEKQGEQKFADKVEPKFHEGDWVVTSYGKVNQVVSVDKDGDGYTLDDGVYFSGSWCDMYHLWTIQDAKDGDVLADGNLPFIFKKIDTNKNSYAYCGISVDDGFKIESDGKFGEWTWMQDIKPAIKKQRDLLFQKMKEAGYEWDAEKKELKEIIIPIFNIGDTIAKRHNSDINDFGSFVITDITGGKYWYNDRIICDITEQDEWELYEPVRQNTAAWSEEDECCINQLIVFCENCMVQDGNAKKCANWLKSLKERYTIIL